MPILHALAEVAVMELFANWITAQFSDIPIDFTVRHGLAAISKGVVLQYTQKSFANLPEQCGAQGVLNYNQLAKMEVSRFENIRKITDNKILTDLSRFLIDT
jgi:pyridoxal biosynthesis lyase PdxS